MKCALLGFLLSTVATCAWAADSHIQHTACAPDTRTTVVGVINQPVTFSFPKGSTVYRVIQSEVPNAKGELDAPWRGPRAEEVKDAPLGNTVPLWPQIAGTSMMSVVTLASDGQTQTTCAFRLVSRPMDAAALDQPDVAFNIIVDGLEPVARAQVVQTQKVAWQAKRDKIVADRLRQDLLKASIDACHYSAKGHQNTTIEPRCPIDNGQWTWIRFPGLSKKPAVYVMQSDGTMRLPAQHGDGDFMVVQEIAPRFRLILGQEVLDLLNNSFEPKGSDPNSGTLSPAINRDIIRQASTP